jgi:3-hydroxy-5-methyl-1-naphthoate 3-O-methyltransferase
MTSQTQAIPATPLMQMTTGFWAFKTLASAHELDLFTRIAEDKGTTTAELCQAAGLQQRPADMLLIALASLGLLEKRADRYYNSAMAEEYLVRGKPYYFGGFIEMLDHRLYPGWGRLTQALKTNAPTTWDPSKQRSLFEGEDPALLETFWQAMHSLTSLTAKVAGGKVNLKRFNRLLDVGGSSGAYDIELCRLYPHLRATVYDLPYVMDAAKAKIEAAGLSDRIDTVAGHFFNDPEFPRGHDLILFSMILHDWDESENRALLRKAYDALEPGGAVMISELLVNAERTGPPPGALMSLNMLIETSGGCNYSVSEYEEWLKDTGFDEVEVVWFEAAGANGVVLGYKR